ncbi:DMT family transporter [Candidatus Gracilibacteria bacterium]|nr:DMT family transporter [Candidatus Gracilibacteria bacterium]
MQKIFLLLSIAFIAAISGAASKYVLNNISVESLMFLRFWVAFICMLPFYSLLKGKSSKDILYLIALSSGMGLSSIFYITGIRTTNLGVAQAIFLLVPIFTLIFSYWFLSEEIKKSKIFGMIISIFGATVIFFLPKMYQESGLNVGDLEGNIYILLGALSYVSYLIFMKRTKFSHMEFMYGGILGSVILGSFLGVYDLMKGVNPYQNITLIDVGLILFIGGIGTVYLYFLVQKLMKVSSAFFTSFGTYIQLIFSTLLGYFFFAEHIGLGFLFGSALTIYGVYYINKGK